MAAYIALIRKEEGTAYGVDFPDFPGCITAGDTLDEARAKAVEVLRFHVAGMVEDGDAVPPPSSLEQVMEDLHNRDAVAFLVDLPLERSRVVRLQVTMDEALLREVDARAEALGKTRSGWLADAARAALGTAPVSLKEFPQGRVIVSGGAMLGHIPHDVIARIAGDVKATSAPWTERHVAVLRDAIRDKSLVVVAPQNVSRAGGVIGSRQRKSKPTRTGARSKHPQN